MEGQQAKRHLRLLIIGGGGAMMTIGILLTLFFLFQNKRGQWPLAERISEDQTILYGNITNKNILPTLLRLVDDGLSPPLPDIASIPMGNHYEFAVMEEAGTGSTWILSIEIEEGKEPVILTPKESDELRLPVKKRTGTLAHSRLFKAFAMDEVRNAVWVRMDAIALQESPASQIIRSVAGSDRQALLLWGEKDRGTMLLSAPSSSQGRSLLRSSINILDRTPLLIYEAGNPLKDLTRIQDELVSKDAALGAGIQGILQAEWQKLTGHTDIATAATQLFSNSLSMATVRDKNGKIATVFSGEAKTPESLLFWMRAMHSSTVLGNVRTITFFRNENIRTDVTGNNPTDLVQTGTNGMWTLYRIGSPSSSVDITIAVDNRRFIASSDPALVTATIETSSQAEGEKLTGNGLVDLRWFLKETRTRWPFVEPELSRFITTLFGTDATAIAWKTQPLGTMLRLDWSIVRDVSTAPKH